MKDELIVDGTDVIFRERFKVYVAVFGPDYVVHFSQPAGTKWVARRPFAFEALCCANTLIECVRLTKRRYDALCTQTEERIRRRLESAFPVNTSAQLTTTSSRRSDAAVMNVQQEKS